MARKTGRDPVSGRPMLDGITAITSERTSAVTYQARWSWMGPAGERRHGAKIFKDLFPAEEHLLEVQLAVRRGTWHEPDRTTLDAYAVRWLDRMATRWAPSTEGARRHGWTGKIAPLIGQIRLVDLRRDHCQHVVDTLHAAGMRPRTVHFHLYTLSGMLEAALADGLIPRNIARKLIMPRIEPGRNEVWTIDQVRRFLDVNRESAYYPMWLLMLATGMRGGEVVALRWRDLDLDRGIVQVRATAARMREAGEGVIETTKTRRSRTVPIPPAVRDCLREHREQQRARPVVDIQGWVFLSRHGRRRSRSGIRWALNRDAERAGLALPNGRIRNPLRHLAATLMASQGAHAGVVQQVLGHRSPEMTLRHYTHLDSQDMRLAVDTLGQSLVPSGTTTSPGHATETEGSA